MRKCINTLPALIFFYILCCGILYGGESKPDGIKNILVLNSYHSGYSWSELIIDGITSTLNMEPGDHYRITVENMDAKRLSPDSAARFTEIKLKKNYSERSFDVIITVDDVAYQFMLDYGSRMFPGTPVIFCGVNNSRINTSSLPSNFTGVMQTPDYRRLLVMMMKMIPNLKQVYYLSDNSITGQGMRTSARARFKSLNRCFRG